MRSFIIFAIATGLNRGSFFILMPLFALMMPVEVFGELSLSFTTSQLLAPLLSLNVAVIISREIYERRIVSFSFNSVLILFSLCVIASSFAIFMVFENLSSLVVCLAASEALFLLVSTYVRYIKEPKYFLIITFVKCLTVALLYVALSVGFISYSGDKLIFVIIISFVLANLISTVFFWPICACFRAGLLARMYSFLKTNKMLFLFAFTMLPHVVAQWAMAGFDRFIIKYFYDELALGIYALSYSLASLYMLVNSALGLALPQLCVKNYEGFVLKRYFYVLFSAITAIWLLFSFSLFFIVPVFFTELDRDSIRIALVLLVGFYLMSFYYYFSSIVFYKRDVFFLSASTVASACVSIVLATAFTYHWGIIGAASAQVFSYFCYLVLVSSKLEPTIRRLTYFPIGVSVFLVVFILYLI